LTVNIEINISALYPTAPGSKVKIKLSLCSTN
jgi:predicted thioesterase